MLRDRIYQLFGGYDSTIQAVIKEVLILEQEYISLERPKLKEQIDKIISRQATKELDQDNSARDGGA